MAFHSFDTGRSGGAGAPHRPMSDINVTPLVDVMLVLLVIFILTAPLMTSAIRLDLPQTAAARPAAASPHQVVLVLDKQGVVHLDDVPQSPDALRRRLQEVAKVHPDTEVQLRADAQAAYGRLVEVIGIAQQAGLSRIGFVADGLPPERNP